MGKVINFPHKKRTREIVDLDGVTEAVMMVERLLDAYANNLEQYGEYREKRKSYLQELDEFEELIHGKHPKLVD